MSEADFYRRLSDEAHAREPADAWREPNPILLPWKIHFIEGGYAGQPPLMVGTEEEVLFSVGGYGSFRLGSLWQTDIIEHIIAIHNASLGSDNGQHGNISHGSEAQAERAKARRLGSDDGVSASP